MNTSDGLTSSSRIIEIVWATDSAVNECPCDRIVRSSSNSRPTWSASRSSPEIVISLPRTMISVSNAS